MKTNRFSPAVINTLLGLAICLLLAPVTSWAILVPSDDHLADFESAVAEFDARDYSTARIHLKNALQKRPDHLPSRLLLGRTELKMGQAPAAEKEFLVALRLGAAKEQVVIPLGNALLLQRKYSDILEKITIDGISQSGRYEVLTLRGRAHYEMGDLEEAHLSFDQALAYNNKLMEAYLEKSRAYSAEGKYVDAEVMIDTALGHAPASAELLYEKAGLRRRQGDDATAMQLYDQALEIYPDHMRARLGRASLNLTLGNLEQARDDAGYVHSAVPQDPDAALIYAQALGRLGQQEKAVEVLHTAGDNLARFKDAEILQQPGLLRIAALISLQQGAVEKANYYLDQYVMLVPHEMRMRKILARVKLELGDGEGAARVLYPFYNRRTKDVELLSLVGEAYLQSGHYAEAQAALEKAVQLQPVFPDLNTRLAFSRIGSGETEEAWQDLTRAHSPSAGASVTAGIVITIMQARAQNYDDALATANILLERQPRNPILHNLVGIVRLGRNELTLAKTAFEQALAADPGFVPAMYNLGLIEQKTNNLDAAEQWFKRIVQIKPEQTNALTALAEIEIIRGDYKGAVSFLEKATIVANSGEISPYLRLVEIHLLLGDIPAAQREANTLGGKYPENAQVSELRGRVELAAGNRQKAINHLRNASRYASMDGVMLIQIADQLVALEDYQAAKAPLEKALNTEKKLLAHDRLVQLYLRQGNPEAARSHAVQVRTAEPDASLGYVLEARILQSEGNYEGAISQYQKAFEMQESRDILLELYKLHFLLGKQERGFQLLEEWLQDHSQDTIIQRNLALGYLKAGQRENAQAMLENLVKSRPRDSLVLASLAQLYQQDGNPDARALAERALREAPDWSIAQDTYGWIMVTSGKAEVGLKYLREAVTRDSNPLIRYHLAAALHALGRDSEALAELEIILRLSNKPPWIDSARELYATIKQTG